MSTETMPRLNPAWYESRRALQEHFAGFGVLPDASRLAYILGPQRTWTTEEVSRMWAEALANPVCGSIDTLNNVYIHVPFCKAICAFCNYERIKPSSPDLLEAWQKRVLESLRVLAPVVRQLRFHTLYIGGGTPSVLPPRMLDPLLQAFDTELRWHPDASRHFEFDPAVMNRDKLRVLEKWGFERFSFGVETLDPKINLAHNRGPQDFRLVSTRFEEFADAGISDLACDFLLGLAGTTPAQMLSEVEAMLSQHRPKRVDLYMITPTDDYVRTHFGGDREAFWAHIAPFEVEVPAALPGLAQRTNYQLTAGQGHHLMLERIGNPGPGHWKSQRSRHSYCTLVSEAGRPLHVLAFGPSARSQIFGYAAFEARDPQHDRASDAPTWFQGHRTSLEAEARSYLVHHLRDNDSVDRAVFRNIFGHDIAEVFPVAIAAWEKQALVRLDPAELRFVPQDRRQRTDTLIWLLPDEHLEFEVAAKNRLDLSLEGVRRLCAGLRDGNALQGGFRYRGVEDTRLRIDGPDGRSYWLRVAPALEVERRLKLVLESPPPAEATAFKALQQSVAVLAKLVRARHLRDIADLRPGEGTPAQPSA